jgi:tetratricopeptide (TPR) repeat protein
MAAVRPGDARRAAATAAAGQLRLQVMFRDAVRMHEQDKLAEAEAAYRRVLEESKAREPRVLARLAQVRLDRKDAVEAAGLAAQALAKRDDDPFIYQVHGVALRRLGRHEEALASLRRAAALAPTDPAVLQSLGNALSARGHYEEAESAFRNSVSRRPATPDVLSWPASPSRCATRVAPRRRWRSPGRGSPSTPARSIRTSSSAWRS